MSEPPDPADRPEVPGHRLLRVVGQGSSAVVWSATDAAGSPVAVKVPHEAPDAVQVREGAIERQVLTAVRHDHLVPLRDVVPLADERVALVFDLVVGATLRSMVGARGHLRPGEAVTLLTPLAEAVAVLHAAGGTHCDISPGNVMVTADGRPMLMDLGSARLAGSGAGSIVGTPGFIAPEVRDGETPTEASDVFAIGALAWFCLTGNGAPDTMLRLSSETISSHVGEELAEVVGTCIDPDPERRPSSLALAARIYAAAAAESIEVVVGADDASALTHRLRAEAARTGEDPAPAGRARRRLFPRWNRSARPRPERPAPARPDGTASARPDQTALGPGRSWFRTAPLTGRRWPRRLGVGAVIALLAVVIGGLVHLRALPGSERTGAASAQPAAPGSSADPPAAVTSGMPTSAAGTGSEAAAQTDRGTGEPSPAAALLRSRVAVREQPQVVIQALTDLRVRALTERKVASLVSVHVKGSPSFDLDAGMIAELLAAGQRYDGLSMTVDRAEHVSGGPTRAVIRARVDLGAYAVVSSQGSPVREAAVIGDVLDFTLVWQPDGWRIESVSEPAST